MDKEAAKIAKVLSQKGKRRKIKTLSLIPNLPRKNEGISVIIAK
jgi:hypothetical protein